MGVLTGLLALGSTTLGAPVGAAGTMPSGQVMTGNTSFSTATMTFTGGGTTVEPAFDAADGSLVYLQTPTNAHVHPPANGRNVAPLYLLVYPTGAGIDPAGLNCAHVPADNCPDHGPVVAGAAMHIVPKVYGGGVAGHDHLVGIASTGGDFNVVWEPTLVLFDDPSFVQRITTLSALDAAEGAGQLTIIPLPQLDFHCSRVAGASYAKGTPAPTIIGP